MTPKATALLDRTLTTHAARVCADPRDPAKSLFLASEANAAHAALAAYIESLEQTRPARGGGELGSKILAHLDHGPARLVDLAVALESDSSNVRRELAKLAGMGRVVRLVRGVWGLEGHTVAALPAVSRAERARNGEIPDAIEAYLRDLGAGVGARPREIIAHLQGRWTLSGNRMNYFLHELEAQGRVVRVGCGDWRASSAVTGCARQ